MNFTTKLSQYFGLYDDFQIEYDYLVLDHLPTDNSYSLGYNVLLSAEIDGLVPVITPKFSMTAGCEYLWNDLLEENINAGWYYMEDKKTVIK